MNTLRGNTRKEPFQSNAEKMSKLIKEKRKMVRRAKAVAAIWGTEDYSVVDEEGNEELHNAWKPFEEKLNEMGFSAAEITFISQHRIDNPIIEMGLKDLL